MKTAIYIRSATGDIMQLKEQFDSLMSYIDKNEITNVALYTDCGIGSARLPAYTQMMKDIESEKIDTVITHSFSRLSRNTANLIESIRALSDKNVRLIAIKEEVEITSGNKFWCFV